MRRKVKKCIPWFLAFFVPVVVFFLAIALLPNFGLPRTILLQDPNNQYLDFLNFYKSVLHGENELLYSFNSGLGASGIGLFAYYLMSPFNLIILFFPDHLVAIGYVVIIALKIGSIGLASYYGFKKLSKREGYFPLIFSLAYTLSAYTLCYFIHFEWLDALIILPLLCVGLDEIIEGKKSWLYIVCLAAALITNYYIGLMLCVFAVIWFVFRMITGEKKDRAEVKHSIIRFFISSVIGGCISAIVLVPAYFGMINDGSRFSKDAFTLQERFPFIQIIEQLTSNSSFGLPLLFMGTPLLFIMILFFANKKIPPKEKVCAGIILAFFALSVSIGFFCAIWHLGSVERGAPFRFTFVCVFFMAYLAMRSFQEIKHVNLKAVLMMALAYGILYLLVMQRDLTEIENGLIIIDLLLLALTVWLAYSAVHQKKNITAKLLCLNSASLVIFAIYNMAALVAIEGGVTQIMKPYHDIKTIAPVIEEVKANDDGFYRLEKTFSRTANDGMQFKYNGLPIYASTSSSNGKALNYFGNALYYASNSVSDNANNGATIYGDMSPLTSTSLYGVKYVVTDKELGSAFEKVGTKNGYNIYKYNQALGIGMVSKASFSDFVPNNNVFENINYVASEITGTDVSPMKPINNYEMELENLVRKGDTFKKIDTEEDGVMNVKIKNPTRQNVFLFAYFGNSKEELLAGRGQISLTEVLKADEGWEMKHLTHLTGGLTNLGNESEIFIKIKLFTDELSLEPFVLSYEDEKEATKFYEKASEQKVEIRQDSATKLSGDFWLDTDDPEYLLFTIPYDQSWTIKVDGEVVEKQRALDSFTSVAVSGSGKHIIELTYKAGGVKIGIIISIVGLISFGCLVVFERKRMAD